MNAAVVKTERNTVKKTTDSFSLKKRILHSLFTNLDLVAPGMIVMNGGYFCPSIKER